MVPGKKWGDVNRTGKWLCVVCGKGVGTEMRTLRWTCGWSPRDKVPIGEMREGLIW